MCVCVFCNSYYFGSSVDQTMCTFTISELRFIADSVSSKARSPLPITSSKRNSEIICRKYTSTRVITQYYKNKNIFEKMSEYVGFLPPPTYFLHTLLSLLHAIVNDHSVYVGSMWVGVRILHIHSFFRKCFYSCLGSFLYIHMHIHLVKKLVVGTQCTGGLDELQQ